MAFWDKLRGELIDIIEWTDVSGNTMVHRFERYGNEIKYGARLTVREGQFAVFINEGRLADVFSPGMYALDTRNLPILSTLAGWKHGFESPFKAEVYFVSSRRFTDQKWGTKNPIMLRDGEFGPVRLRAFGTYEIRVVDAGTFIREIVGTDGHFTTDEITDQTRNIVVSRFADAMAESQIPVLEMAANYDELGKLIQERIQPEFAAYGLELMKLLVENISLPEEVEKALDQRTSMGVIGNMQQYTQYKTAEAIGDAAKNPGGLGAAGVGVGAGFAMGNQMAGAMAGSQQASTQVPPPLPTQAQYFVAVAGQQTGPFPVDALARQAQSGQLTRDTLVWSQGMASWTPAAQVAALSHLFASPPPMPGTPPPVPPAG